MGETIRIGQVRLDFVATGKETQEHATVFELTVPPAARVPAAHYHRSVEEVVYGLDGVLTYTIDGKKLEVRRGESVLVPRGAVHHFVNLHPEDAKALIVLTPSSIGPAFFRETAEVVNAGGPPDIRKIHEVMQRHGLVPAAM